MMASQQKQQNQQGAYTAETMTTAAASSSTGGGDCPTVSRPRDENFWKERCEELEYRIQQMQTEHRQEMQMQILNQQHRKELKDATSAMEATTNSATIIDNNKYDQFETDEGHASQADAKEQRAFFEKLMAKKRAHDNEQDRKLAAVCDKTDAQYQSTEKDLAGKHNGKSGIISKVTAQKYTIDLVDELGEKNGVETLKFHNAPL